LRATQSKKRKNNVAWFVCGRAIQGYSGGLAHTITAGGKPWDWIGGEAWFFRGVPVGDHADDAPPCSFLPGLGYWRQVLRA
jgi:hypothetical protein